MASIEFRPIQNAPDTPIERVFLDGKHVGTVFRMSNIPRYYYRPRGSTHSIPHEDTFATLGECHQSVRGDS